MIDVGFNTKDGWVKKYSIPQMIDEMSAEQFLKFCELTEKINAGEMTVKDASLEFVMQTLPISEGVTTPLMKENVAYMSILAEPLFFSRLSHQKNPISSIKLAGGEEVKCVAWALADATARTFLHLSTALHDYMEAEPEDRSDKMKAVARCLYPSEKHSEGVRKVIDRLNDSVLSHLVGYATASMNYLCSGEFKYYTATISFKDIFCASGKKTGHEKDKSFADALMAIGETGAFGDYEKVLDTNIVTILRHLQLKHKESQELKKKLKK